MVLISIEQRMLLQSQLTALAGRVVEEEGGCNSTWFQGWNNTKLPIMCRSTCYVLFMILNQILWIYRFWAILCWNLGNGPFSSLNQVVTIYHYLFEQVRVGCTQEWCKCLKRLEVHASYSYFDEYLSNSSECMFLRCSFSERVVLHFRRSYSSLSYASTTLTPNTCF
jgi:hypothetical protein